MFYSGIVKGKNSAVSLVGEHAQQGEMLRLTHLVWYWMM